MGSKLEIPLRVRVDLEQWLMKEYSLVSKPLESEFVHLM